jgi:hypothetical protein
MDTNDRWDTESAVLLSRLKPSTRVLIEMLVDRRGGDLVAAAKEWVTQQEKDNA